MADRPVYSTSKLKPVRSKGDEPSGSYIQGEGPVKVRLEKKGRGGKTVTVAFNLPFGESDARSLLRELQTHLACGGTLKNSTLELRGDVRDRVLSYLVDKKRIKAVKAGG